MHARTYMQTHTCTYINTHIHSRIFPYIQFNHVLSYLSNYVICMYIMYVQLFCIGGMCMCACLSVCMGMDLGMGVCLCALVHTHVCVYMCMHVHVHVCVCVHVGVYVRVCLSPFASVSVCVFTHVCVCHTNNACASFPHQFIKLPIIFCSYNFLSKDNLCLHAQSLESAQQNQHRQKEEKIPQLPWFLAITCAYFKRQPLSISYLH